MKAMKKLLVLFLALATVFALAAIPAFAAEDGYTDVNEKDWFAGAVEYAAENGLMNGVGDNKFAPAAISTRGMVVTILHRMEGEPKSENKVTFTDLKQDWYKGAVAWANEQGVVEGYSATAFGPEDEITREQLATMAYRFAVKVKGENEILGGTWIGRGFADFDTISDWANIGMLWAVGEGLIQGVETNGKLYLDPQGEATRAQLATVLMRLNEKLVNHTHNLEYTAAVEATCHQNGMQEYWYCADCDCYFSDAEGKYNVAYLRLTIPATVGLTYVPAAEACHVPGINEYWYCTECEAVYADAEGKVLTNRKNLEIEPDTELTHVAAAEPNCHQPGYAEHWYCEDCKAVYTDAEGKNLTNIKNIQIPAAPLVYVEAVEACHENGSYEYWYCEECDAVFADAQGTQLTNRKNLTIVADEKMIHVPAVEATCHKNGNVEYWYCDTCKLVSTDAEGKQLSNIKRVIIPATDLMYQEAVPACHLDGTLEYWYCEKCDTVFADADCTIVTNRKNLTLPADEKLTHVEAAEATCHQPGNIEYWYCETCKLVYTDAEGTQLSNFKNVQIPAEPLAHQEAVPACHLDGTVEYWYCEECDAVFADAQGTILTNRKNLTLPADEELTHKAAAAPVCHQPGNLEYWYCETCKAVYTDEAGTQISNVKNVQIPAVPLTYADPVAATCAENGSYGYWYCEECEAVFADAQGTQITNRKNLTIPATGLHNYVDHQCTVCYNYDGSSAEYAIAIHDASLPTTISLDANETIYVAAQVAGQILTINDAADAVVTLNDTKYVAEKGVITVEIPAGTGMGRPMPTTLAISSELGGEFVLRFAYPEGHSENPAELVIGKNTAVGGSQMGYHFDWIAAEDGTLTLTMPETGWTFTMNNETAGKYGDYMDYSMEEIENSIEVEAGDLIHIMVNTYDAENLWEIPEGKVEFTAAFVAAE